MLLGEAQHPSDALGEFGVGLVEDRVSIIFRCGSHCFHQTFSRLLAVVEVSRFSRKSLAMFGIFLVSPAPEIRRIGYVRIIGVDDRQCALSWTQNISRAASPGSVFQRVSWLALGDVHTDCHGIVGHA